jgi:cbb3-type cytochrome oxidase maturation FixS-like protein
LTLLWGPRIADGCARGRDLRSGQYDDLDGAAERILFDDDVPLKDKRTDH